MDPSFSFLIMVGVPLLLLAIVGIIVHSIVSKVKDTVDTVSMAVLGTTDIAEGIERRKFEFSSTPKTVAAATSLYLPQIQRDFPEFSYEEAKLRAENALIGYLRAIDQNDPGILSDASAELKEQLTERIHMLRDMGQREQFDKIKVHETAINRYFKDSGRCSIVFQSSVQYLHCLKDTAGNTLKGDAAMYEQARYNVTMAYVQDAAKSNDMRDFALGLTCPNCGAPVATLGQKTCEYCGSGLVETNRKVWHFHEIKQA